MSTGSNNISFDVLFVGAGIASLSSAYKLKQLVKKSNNEELKKIKIAVLEKSSEVGDHVLSGACFNPKVLYDLIPNFESIKKSSFTKVTHDQVRILFKHFSFSLPITPPMMNNEGNIILSLSELTRWIGKLCENEGIEIYTSEPAVDILYDDKNNVIGVRTGEKGIDKNGKRKINYLAGAEIFSKVTIFGEGSRGYLTKKLTEKFNLNDKKIPQGHAIGVKEIWEVDDKHFKTGSVTHTMFYPLGLSTLGGGFIYHFDQNLIALGLVTSLDYKNPNLDPFEMFQRWKLQPYIKKQLTGGKLVAYGAKTLSEGGLYSVPKLYGNGFMIIGEAGGLLNSAKLKGIDMAVQSGIYSAETIFKAFENKDFSNKTLSTYSEKINSSWIYKELWKARNFHQGFHRGLIPGAIHTSLQMITNGRGLIDKFKTKPDYQCMNKRLTTHNSRLTTNFKPNGIITFDRLTDVYKSGTIHEEDQPCHLIVKEPKICSEKCFNEFDAPCQRFCPAKVYEIVENENGKKQLHINPTNCIHCKTCEIKDPYAVIDWVPPEGSGGPRYGKM